jgi:hypothetical protein
MGSGHKKSESDRRVMLGLWFIWTICPYIVFLIPNPSTQVFRLDPIPRGSIFIDPVRQGIKKPLEFLPGA